MFFKCNISSHKNDGDLRIFSLYTYSIFAKYLGEKEYSPIRVQSGSSAFRSDGPRDRQVGGWTLGEVAKDAQGRVGKTTCIVQLILSQGKKKKGDLVADDDAVRICVEQDRVIATLCTEESFLSALHI